MKLNKNASEKLCDLINNESVYDIFWKNEDAFLEREDGFVGFELDQSDVQGVVVLTIEEANKVLNGFSDALYKDEGSKNYDADEEALSLLGERIAKAEGK